MVCYVGKFQLCTIETSQNGGYHAPTQKHQEAIRHRGLPRTGPGRSQYRLPRVRIRVHPGSLGLRQDHSAQHRRRPGPLLRGRPPHQRQVHRGLQGPRLGYLPQPQRGLRLPELQPHPPPDRSLQRGAGSDPVGHLQIRTPTPRRRGSPEGRSGGSAEQEAQPDVGRSDAARGHRPRHRQRSRYSPGRRAHGRSGHRDLGADHGDPEGDRQGQAGHHGHAQPRAGGGVFHPYRTAPRR